MIENIPGVVLNRLLALSQALVNLKRCEELIPVVDQILELADELENFHAKFVGHHNSTSREELPMQFWQELIQEHIVGAREKLGEVLARKYEAEGAAMELEEAIAYALDFKKD